MKNPAALVLIGSALLLASCDTTPVADTTKPAVTLTVNPTALTAAGTVALKATASDNVGVTRVTFYRGTTKLSEDTTAPYETTDSLTAAQNGAVTYRAVATDAAGNQGEATASVTVNIADPVQPSYNVSGTLKEPTFNETNLTFGTRAWTGGAGSLIADGDDGEEVTRTSLGADGSFNLALPQTLAADRLSSLDVAALNSAEGCTGSFTSSAQANGALLELRVDATKDGPVAPATLSVLRDSQGIPTGISTTTGVLVYVDRAVTVKGSQTCTVSGDSATFNVDWQLRQGWNKTNVIANIGLDLTVDSLSLTSGDLPGDWLYLGEDSVATPLSLSKPGLKAALREASVKASQLPLFR